PPRAPWGCDGVGTEANPVGSADQTAPPATAGPRGTRIRRRRPTGSSIRDVVEPLGAATAAGAVARAVPAAVPIAAPRAGRRRLLMVLCEASLCCLIMSPLKSTGPSR